MMQVGLEFGALLGRFLVDFGAKLGGKLDRSWHQNLKKLGPKTMLTKMAQKNLTRNPGKLYQTPRRGGGHL